MRVALVHDWLTNMGGAERVLLALSELYPDAPIYTSVYEPDAVPAFKDKKVIPSFLQKVPFAKRHHQLFPTLRPVAFESFDLSEFDVVISSASAEAKGIITKPETLHICYCHTPTRYYWSDYHAYRDRLQFGFFNAPIRWMMPGMTNKMRLWDYAAAQRVDSFIANSKNTADRIKKYYHRDSTVIHPPVDTELFSSHKPQATGASMPYALCPNYFLVVSRLVPYKRIDIVVEAFNQLQLPLKIVGTGPELKRLQQLNTNPKTEFLGIVPELEKVTLYQSCKAFIFPTEEDAGITPLEAMAAGRPVIAYDKGGALETVIEGKTGTFFHYQTPMALADTITSFDESRFSPEQIMRHAEQFSAIKFQEQMRTFVEQAYAQYPLPSTPHTL